MFNHFRTLLLNLPGEQSPVDDLFAEELIPADYVPVDTAGYLDTVRKALFGNAPDRSMLNYRVRQYLSLIHATELSQFVTAFDHRITYDVTSNDLVGYEFGLTSRQIDGGPTSRMFFFGSQKIPDITGKIAYRFDVRFLSSSSLQVTRQYPNPASSIFDAGDPGEQLTPQIPLEDTGFSFSADKNNLDARFVVSGTLRPQWDMSIPETLLRSIGETVTVQLFGAGSVEPYSSLRNLWQYHKDMPYRLGAVVVALVYRMEERRSVVLE